MKNVIAGLSLGLSALCAWLFWGPATIAFFQWIAGVGLPVLGVWLAVWLFFFYEGD